MGNVTRVRIWVDHWIPSLKTAPLPCESCGLDIQEARVNQIIDNTTLTWALYSIFSPLIAAEVLKMPLTQALHNDKFDLGGGKHGRFSVRRIYHLIQSHRSQLKGKSFHHHDHD